MSRKGNMHAATIDNSPRLRRVLEYLRGGPRTTLQIVRACGVCAVNSAVAELRCNGFDIACRAVPGLRGVYEYELRT